MTRILTIDMMIVLFLSFLTILFGLIATTQDVYYHWIVLLFLYLFIGCESVLAILLNIMCLDTPRVAIGIVVFNMKPASFKTGTVGRSYKSANVSSKKIDVVD